MTFRSTRTAVETYLLPRAIICLLSPWSVVASLVASQKSVGFNEYNPDRDEHVWWFLTFSLWVPLSHFWSSGLAHLLSLPSVWNICMHVHNTMSGKKSYIIMQAGDGGARSCDFSEVSMQPGVVHSKDLSFCFSCCFWGIGPPWCLVSASWTMLWGW